MPFLQVNGTRLYYERTGAGDPLVLVHGSWVDSSVWKAVLPTLARSFDVVSYDRRCRSRSSCPADLRPPFFKRIVELLVAVIPGASSESIPGIAHDPQVTHPDSYARAVSGLARVELR
jgi:pimeloyl-ACP methyl ester carboxylesterase